MALQFQIPQLIRAALGLRDDVVHREPLPLAVWVQPALALALLAQAHVALDDDFPQLRPSRAIAANVA